MIQNLQSSNLCITLENWKKAILVYFSGIVHHWQAPHFVFFLPPVTMSQHCSHCVVAQLARPFSLPCMFCCIPLSVWWWELWWQCTHRPCWASPYHLQTLLSVTLSSSGLAERHPIIFRPCWASLYHLQALLSVTLSSCAQTGNCPVAETHTTHTVSNTIHTVFSNNSAQTFPMYAITQTIPLLTQNCFRVWQTRPLTKTVIVLWKPWPSRVRDNRNFKIRTSQCTSFWCK